MLLHVLRLARVPGRLSHRLCSSSSSSSSSSPPSPNPNPEPLTKTIHKLFKQRDPDKLVAAFIAASSSYRFRCKHRIYEIAVRRLAAASRPDAVEAILEHQKLYFTTPDPSTTTPAAREGFAVRLISLYGHASMLAHAAATFHQLPSLLHSPRTVISFNALLTACFDAKDFDRLATTFCDVPAADPSIVPDRVSYNILIQSLCAKGDPSAALGTLKTMDSNGIAPDLLTFNILLNAFYTKGRFADADQVFEIMRDRNIAPDTKSYNAKLRGLVSDGKTTEAAELVSEMKRIGVKPDTFSFNALIKGYCQGGNLEEAKRLYMDLIKNDCAPNRPTFETLVPYLCKAGELDLAVKLCNESISRRFFVHSTVLQEVVEGLAKASRVEEAKKLVKLGRANNYPRKNLRMPSSGSAA